MNKQIILSALAGTLIVSSGMAFAADGEKPSPAMVEQTTGRQLMTTEEQNEYRAKMRNATSTEEKKEVRKEHHERMKERAQEKGVSIPDNPPEPGQRSGMSGRMGGGQGGGMGGGQGGGMGSGR